MSKTSEQKYCHECGHLISIRAEICPSCGVRQPHNSLMAMPPSSGGIDIGQGTPRKKNTAAVLALLLGGLGMHKFYLGRPLWGIAYIVFCFTMVPPIVAIAEAIYLYLMTDYEFNKKFGGPSFSTNNQP